MPGLVLAALTSPPFGVGPAPEQDQFRESRTDVRREASDCGGQIGRDAGRIRRNDLAGGYCTAFRSAWDAGLPQVLTWTASCVNLFESP